MATRRQVETAIRQLATALDRVDPKLREQLIQPRTVSLVVPDLDLAYTAKLDGGGLTEVAAADEGAARQAEVRFVAPSEEVVRIGPRPAGFVSAWVQGKVRVHAGLRDLLELRRLVTAGFG